MSNLSALHEAATPAPWHVREGTFGKVHDPRSATVYATNDDLVYVARCDGSQPMVSGDYSSVGIPDARLIAALRNAYADGSLCPYPDALIEAADALLFAIEHEGKHALKSTMLLNALATYRRLREGE